MDTSLLVKFTLGTMFWRGLSLIFMFGLVAVVEAKTLDDLHRVSISVADQSDAVREEAFKNGFKEVMHRVSLQKALSTNNDYLQTIDKAGIFVNEYAYVKDDSSNLTLDIGFNKAALKRFVTQAKLPYWGEDRPDVLLWVAAEDESGRYLVGRDSNGMVKVALQQNALHAGLPINLPIVDEQDTSMLSMVDIWGRFNAPIIQASQRYTASVVASLGLAKLANGQWSARWLLIMPQGQHTWEDQGASLDATVEQGITRLSETMASVYAYTPTQTDSDSLLVLSISEVDSAEKYASVMRYLRDVPGVRQVYNRGFANGQLEVYIALLVSQQDFSQSLNIQRKLESVPSPGSSFDASSALFYRYAF